MIVALAGTTRAVSVAWGVFQWRWDSCPMSMAICDTARLAHLAEGKARWQGWAVEMVDAVCCDITDAVCVLVCDKPEQIAWAVELGAAVLEVRGRGIKAQVDDFMARQGWELVVRLPEIVVEAPRSVEELETHAVELLDALKCDFFRDKGVVDSLDQLTVCFRELATVGGSLRAPA